MRRVNTPSSAGTAGSVRGVDPVAMTRPSNPSRVPSASSTSRVPRSSAVAAVPEPQLELELVVGLLAEHGPVALPLPREQLLRERRTVVGQVRFGADQHETAVEALAPQGLDRAQTGERRADDDDGPQRH